MMFTSETLSYFQNKSLISISFDSLPQHNFIKHSAAKTLRRHPSSTFPRILTLKLLFFVHVKNSDVSEKQNKVGWLMFAAARTKLEADQPAAAAFVFSQHPLLTHVLEIQRLLHSPVLQVWPPGSALLSGSSPSTDRPPLQTPAGKCGTAPELLILTCTGVSWFASSSSSSGAVKPSLAHWRPLSTWRHNSQSPLNVT